MSRPALPAQRDMGIKEQATTSKQGIKYAISPVSPPFSPVFPCQCQKGYTRLRFPRFGNYRSLRFPTSLVWALCTVRMVSDLKVETSSPTADSVSASKAVAKSACDCCSNRSQQHSKGASDQSARRWGTTYSVVCCTKGTYAPCSRMQRNAEGCGALKRARRSGRKSQKLHITPQTSVPQVLELQDPRDDCNQDLNEALQVNEILSAEPVLQHPYPPNRCF